jgi:hypothetical protein
VHHIRFNEHGQDRNLVWVLLENGQRIVVEKSRYRVECGRVKRQFSIFVLGLCVAVLGAVLPANASVNVTQHHNHLSRDGLYIDSIFTAANAANLTRDTNFDGTIVGNVFAQPLYIENGPGGQPMVIAVTESNNVYALNAFTGAIIWQRNVGTPVTSGLPCGSISPLGILGTPVVDLPSRALFFDAMIDGTTKKHFIYSLNVDTGAINAGWPVDVNAKATFGGLTFTSSQQNQRAALGLVNGVIYVPYSGLNGDCGTYHGWVVGVPINNPASVTSWATTAVKGGIWGHGGVASDGTDTFVVTGNTSGTGGTFGQGEAIIRLHAGPIFSNTTTNFWAPTNWLSLDNSDLDLGGCGAVLIDAPGATPSQLVLALGKDNHAYLVSRANLGGITSPIATATVSTSGSNPRGQAAATYRTSQGTYFVLRASTTTIGAYKINATNPPTITTAWSATQSGLGSPFVTSTDGTSNAIVWVVGSQGDQRLHGYNGDTGAVVYAGGGANELMTATRYWNTGIEARGRIYLASDNKVYAFTVPIPALQVTSAVSRMTHTGAGTFDITLPGVECRSGGASGNYSLVFTFSNNLESGNASVTSGTGSVSGTPTVSGNTMTVNLTGVISAQSLTVTLSSVTDQFLQVLPDTPVTMSVLIGDTNANSVVNASDVAQTKGQIGVAVTSANFRTDVNANGAVNGTDVALVKSHIGESVGAAATGTRRNPTTATGH